MRKRFLILAAVGCLALVAHADDEPVSRPDRLTVLDPGGNPVRGAFVVEALDLDGRPLFDPRAPVQANTAANGVAEDLGAPSVARLVVWAPGRAATLVPATAFEATVTLAPGHGIEGVVRYSRGSAAAGVHVLAVPESESGLAFRTRTDATGRYEVECLPAGRFTLFLLRAGGRVQSLGAVTAGDVAPEAILVGAASVAGKVLDGDGKSRDVAAGVPLRFTSMPGMNGPEVVRDVTSGPDGRFELGDLVPGIYRVDVVGLAWEIDQPTPFVTARPGKTRSQRPWFVRHLVSVSGSVTDTDRGPLEGASVRLLREAPDDPEAELAALRVRPARSAADGRFRLDGVSPGEGFRLVVTASGFSPWISRPFRIDRKTGAALKAARLVPGWTLEVRVRDSRGAAVVGVSVTGTPTTHPATEDEPVRAAFVRRAKTDDAGIARLPDLLDADVRIVIGARGWLEYDDVVPVPVSGRNRRADAVLVPAVRLTGRVARVDGPLDAPVRVRVVPHDGVGVAEMRTDSSGRFAFDGLRPVATDLEVRQADGGDVVLARQQGLLLTDAIDLQVTLPPTYAISGVVTGLDANGPAPIVVLEAPIRDPERERFRWETVQSLALEREASGEALFRFEDLPPGPYALRAIQGARDSSARSVRLDDVLLEDIELPIPYGARIAGVVLDGRDDPLFGAVIRLERLRGDGDVPRRPGAPIETTTSASGEYVLTGVAPGVWRVRASYERTVQAALDVRVGEGDVLVVEDLVLGAGGTVTGRVVDDDGRPMDGARLRLRDRGRRYPDRSARTDEEGRYTVPFVPPGLFLLTLETATKGADQPEAHVEVAGTETVAVDFDVEGNGRIEGTVTRRGHRVAGALLELVSEPDDPAVAVRRYRARTDGTGAFAWQALAAGAYRLELRYGSARSARAVWLDDGDRVTLDVEAAVGRLVGRVETRGGRAVSGADVIARALDEEGAPEPSGVEARGRTSPQGGFVLSGLPLGWYAIEVAAPGLPPGLLAAAEAEEAGADRPITIVLGRGGDLDLEIRDRGRRGVTGAKVWIENENGLPFHSEPYVTGPRGRLLIEGIPAGDVLVRVHARGYGRPPVYGVSISEGGSSRLQIPLGPPGVLRLIVSGTGRDPVTRARIDVLREGTDEVVERRRPLGRVRLDPRWGYVPKTGELVIDELETGAYEVVIDAGDTYPITRVGVDVAAGEVTVARIELVPR